MGWCSWAVTAGWGHRVLGSAPSTYPLQLRRPLRSKALLQTSPSFFCDAQIRSQHALVAVKSVRGLRVPSGSAALTGLPRSRWSQGRPGSQRRQGTRFPGWGLEPFCAPLPSGAVKISQSELCMLTLLLGCPLLPFLGLMSQTPALVWCRRSHIALFCALGVLSEGAVGWGLQAGHDVLPPLLPRVLMEHREQQDPQGRGVRRVCRASPAPAGRQEPGDLR